jgi:hypothetical protein
MSTQDEAKLSIQERQQIARMQAALQAADPELAKILRREKFPPRHRLDPTWHEGRSRFVADLTRAGVGPLALLAGLAIMLLTVATELWLSILGALIATAGLWLWFSLIQQRRALQAPARAVAARARARARAAEQPPRRA